MALFKVICTGLIERLYAGSVILISVLDLAQKRYPIKHFYLKSIIAICAK